MDALSLPPVDGQASVEEESKRCKLCSDGQPVCAVARLTSAYISFIRAPLNLVLLSTSGHQGLTARLERKKDT